MTEPPSADAAASANSQDPVVAFLGDPRTHLGQRVERIETHASIVFLVGARAYKLKRAVRYPYLDYSTPALRRAACAAEVALNRRTAPDLYLGVAAVVRVAAGGLVLSEIGTEQPNAVDWVVVMRRFDEATLFDRMADRGALEPELMRELADVIAVFHEHAARDRGGDGARQFASVIDANIAELEDDPRTFAPAVVAEVTRAARAALARVAPVLDARARGGYVRRCHGDLHLRNICLFDGHPTLFDGIEFSETLATIDVLYDLAFLLMDLEHRHLRPLANIVLNRYLERSDEHAGLIAMPLFLATRAAVRAKVLATLLHQSGPNAQPGLDEATAQYMDLALRLLAPRSPHVVAIGGLSGVGKTTLAARLAPTLGPVPGAVIVRSDILRKRLMGVGELVRLPSSAYTPESTRQVYAAVTQRVHLVVSSGYAVIADAVLAQPDQRDALEHVARKAGVPFTGLWLEADPDTLVARVGVRQHDASDATATVIREQLGYDIGDVRWHRIDARGSPDIVAARALAVLGSG